MQDLLDHGESRKKQEEAEFARIDAQAKDERDKEMGFRGKVRLYNAINPWTRVTSVPDRSSMFLMDQTLSWPGRNQRLSLVSSNG
jgi:hypothetical protein